MQNSLNPCPLFMQVYHNYTMRRTGGVDRSTQIIFNFLTVNPAEIDMTCR